MLTRSHQVGALSHAPVHADSSRLTNAASSRTLLAVSTLLLAAGSVLAVDPCTAVWPGMPDFDQRRAMGLDLEGVFHPGLPGNGGSHCAPTAALNMLAFIANNGYPQVLSGPRDWHSPVNYDFVTGALYNLGEAMGTTVDGGTGFSGWNNAMRDWLNQVAPEHFEVGFRAYDGDSNPISPFAISYKMQGGSIVSICYGRYQVDPENPIIRFRGGGHCCTVRHVLRGCDNIPEMSLRNPDNSSSMVTQSSPDFSVSDMVWTAGGYRPSEESPNTYIWNKVYRFADFAPDSSTYRLLDGACWVTPIFGLDVEPQLTPDAGINIKRPVRLTDSLNPTHTHTIPGVGQVLDLALSPDHTTCFISAAGTPTRAPSLWQLNIVTGEASEIATSSTPPVVPSTVMCTSRFGDLYHVQGSTLRRVRPDGETNDPGCVLPQPALDIAYDDNADQVVILMQTSTGGLQLGVVGRNSGGTSPRLYPLPSGLDIAGRPHIMVDPTGDIFFASDESTSVYRLGIDPGSPTAQTREHILLARQVGAMQTTSGGSLMIVSGGQTYQMKRNPAGGWSEVNTSPLAGQEASPFFTVSLGRYGNDDSIADGLPPIDESDLPSQLDCPADFNNDGGIDGSDIEAFFQAWQAGDPQADMNIDGGIDGADVEAFFTAWERGSCE